MPSIENQIDFFLEHKAAPYYIDAAMSAIDRGQSFIHHHDAFGAAVVGDLDADTSRIFCFLAMNRAREANEEAAYLPYERLPKGWIDDFEAHLDLEKIGAKV